MNRIILVLVLLVVASSPAHADQWAVDYISANNWSGKFYPAGAYFFLCCDNGGSGGVLYGMTAEGGWKYLPGYYVYGATPLVPADIPPIVLTSNAFNPGTGNYQAVAVNISYGGGGGGGAIVPVPELAILRRHALSFLGVKVAEHVNPTLQRITTFAAAKLLGAKHEGTLITLPSLTMEVQEWCGGLIATKWLMVFALLFGLVVYGLMRRLELVKVMGLTTVLMTLATVTGVEANILRVAATGVGLEWYGVAMKDTIKEWTGWGALAFGVGQVVVLGTALRGR